MQCLPWINAWARENITRPALIYEDAQGELNRLSWNALRQRVIEMAAGLKRQGFQPGDRLVHAEGNTDQGVILALASLVLGTIEVPLEPGLSSDAYRATFAHVDGKWFENTSPTGTQSAAPEHLLTEFSIREQSFAPEHPTLILFTSGTTGLPRGVTLSRKNLFSNARAKLLAVPQQASDVRLTLLPLWHAYARTCDLMTWLISGCSLAIGLGWNGWQRLAPCVQPMLLNTVPSLASRIMASEMGTPATNRLRWLGCGGAAMAAELFEQFRKHSVTVIQGYGLTEASPVVCSATPQNARPGFVGKPVSGCLTRLSEYGTLEISGDGLMLGYWNDSESTQSRMADGWLDTGDCVEVDPSDGQFRILGRNDDRITLANGLKLFPGPIEQRAALSAGVRHALVVGQERHVTMFIDAACEPSDAPELLAKLQDTLQALPHWQRPRRIELLSQPFADIPGAVTQKGTLCRPIAIPAALAQRLKTED